jgi:NAD(P)-dependent dehydrogenase (short-subunit alcohol dehydrogenase family)
MGDLEGRRFLVTGANTGIGKATAHALADRGAHVLIGCRSEGRAQPAIADIVARTGNPWVEFLQLDLGDLASVRAAAATLLEGRDPLHVLVNNAGVAGQRGLTADGFELAFGINHLGHFLLTQLLLPRLQETGDARIVNVSSDSHYSPKGIDFDAVRRPTATTTGMREYGVSKLCNVLFTQELARRLDGRVTTYALHPGVIASDIWRRVPFPIDRLMKLFMKSTEQGAETSVYCATAPELAGVSGRYYENCAEREPSAVATPELAAELWTRSEEWVALG